MDEMCGKGQMNYFEGHVYIGEWKNNKKNGFGKFTYAKGHVYEGQWKGDKPFVLVCHLHSDDYL